MRELDVKKRVAITPRTFGRDDEPVRLLRAAGFELVFNPYDRPLNEAEMAELLEEADAAIVGLDPVTERVLERASRLKVVSKYGVGLDNIDLEAARRRGVAVTNTPGTNSGAVAELAIGLMLDVARKISLSDREIRSGIWRRHPGFELAGKRLGLVGTGTIGREVAARIKGFGMEIVCYDKCPDPRWADRAGASYLSLEELFATSDVVSLHLPLTEETHHLVSDRLISLMKPTAILINTARGGIVDEEALLRALRERRIAGAGLDVFEAEPPGASPLCSLENVVLTAHIGAHTREAILAMGMAAARNVIERLQN